MNQYPGLKAGASRGFGEGRDVALSLRMRAVRLHHAREETAYNPRTSPAAGGRHDFDG